MRDGKPVELTVNIGELPNEEDLRASAGPARETAASNAMQLEVEPLDDEVRQQLGVDKGGVVVVNVTAGGPADKAGILVGDVMLMVDNKPLDTPEQFDQVLGELDDRGSVAVLVQRAEGPVFLALKLPPDEP